MKRLGRRSWSTSSSRSTHVLGTATIIKENADQILQENGLL
jgi:hypothetical protein